MSRLFSLFSQMLTDSAPITPEHQHRIYKWATTHNQENLLVTLAKRADLDTEIDTLLGTSRSAAVLAAWVSRAGRSMEEITALIKRETRGTVLEQLATRGELPEEAYRQLGALPTQAVMLNLLCNNNVDAGLKTQVAAKFATVCKRQTYDLQNKITQIVKSQPQLLETMVDANPTDAVLRSLFGAFDIATEQSKLKMVHRFGEVLKALPDTLGWVSYEAFNVIGSALDNVEVRKAVTASIPTKHENYSVNSQVQELHRQVKLRAEGTFEKLEAFATGNDPAEILALVRQIVAGRHRDFETTLIAQVFANSSASIPALTELISHCRYRTDWAVLVNRADFADLFAELCVNHLHLLQDEIFSLVGDSKQYMLTMLDHIRAQGAQVPNWVMNNRILKDEEVLHRLPMSFFRLDRMSSKTAKEWYVKTVLAALSTDDKRWETFETLSEQFDGSLPDLLETVEKLSS